MIKVILLILITSGIILGIFYNLNLNKPQSAQSKTEVVSYESLLEENGVNLDKNNSSLPIVLSGWIAYWNEVGAMESMQKNPKKIDHVLPFWYRVNKEGKIIEVSDSTHKSQVKDLALQLSMKIMPSIINEFDPESVSNFLNNLSEQEKAITDLTFIAVSNGYRGFDLDWEEMYVGDKQGFTDFVENLSNSLHKKGLLLSVTVQAKTGTQLDNPSSEAQDWVSLSKFSDEVRIMAYDFHNSDSEAGPITPLDLYIKTLDIALAQIPKEKIVVALPAYGYDWVGMKGVPVQYEEAIQKLREYKTEPERDSPSQELTGKYNNLLEKHELWFEDAVSAEIRIKIAKSKGINKFSFWRLGGEDPKIWDLK